MSLPFIIAGGGIGGMTAALALSKKGYRSLVLEQAAYFREAGAGIQLAPNVFKMFEALQISESIHKIAEYPEAIHIMDGVDKTELLNFPLGEKIIERFKYPYAVFHREDLLRTLIHECRQSPLITLITSAKVVGYTDLHDKVVVKTENGNAYEGTGLIVAEGLWSVLRASIVGDGPPRASGDIGYRGLITRDKMPEKLRTNEVFLWAIPDGHFVHYPLQQGKHYNLVAVFHSSQFDKGRENYGGPDELHEKFAVACPEIHELLKHINENQKWMLYDRDPISQWTKGRATLLGDAAHPTLQYMAQGAGLAIEDAVVLAEKVAACHGDCHAAFIAYQKERYLRTGQAQLTARYYGILQHASGVLREIRNQNVAGRPYEENYEMMEWIWRGIDGS